MNPAIFMSKPALYVYAIVAAIALYSLWEGHVSQKATAACENKQKAASVELKASAAIAGTKAVESVQHANKTDAPAVDLAANRVRNACVLRPVSPPIPDGASSQAQDSRQSQADADAETQQYLNDAADDIRTCQAELNRFAGLQQERAALTAVSR